MTASAQEAARLLAHNTRHEAAWEEGGTHYGWHGRCSAYWCNYERARGSEFCCAHQWVGEWYDEATDPDHPANLGWYRDQLSSPETQAHQAVNAVIAANYKSSRAARYKLAVIAIKAIRRLPLDGPTRCGGTWEDLLDIVVGTALENSC